MTRLLIIAGVTYLLVRLVLYLRKPARRRVAPAVARGPNAHEMLGVEPGASRDQIRRAYQDKIRQYHPDRVASLGPELQEIAEQRTKELNAAYRELVDDA